MEGYPPSVCTHPEEALALFEKGCFLLAFVDIHLPVMSGLELASKIKEIDPRVEIILMTGYGTLENAVEAIKIGASDYLRKPFGISEPRLCVTRFKKRRVLSEHSEQSEHCYFSLLQNIPSTFFLRSNLSQSIGQEPPQL